MKKTKKLKPDFSEEKKLWQRGFNFVAGLDEAGRGPLAGPIVAAAVCFPFGKQTAADKLKIKNEKLKILVEIRDSKQLSARQREQWYKFLTGHPDVKYGVGAVSEKIIDKINILAATKLAMKKALADLEKRNSAGRRVWRQTGVRISRGEASERFSGVDYLLIDGLHLLDNININQKAVPRGDEKIWSCAAASIIAKVTRDRLMVKYDKKFPAYGFARHKGYGTKKHFSALKKHGPCAIHRRTFAPLKPSKVGPRKARR